jgi:hypothetical protein
VGIFAFVVLLPLMVYCLVQTARDVLRRSWLMVIWGVATNACLFWVVANIFARPGY